MIGYREIRRVRQHGNHPKYLKILKQADIIYPRFSDLQRDKYHVGKRHTNTFRDFLKDTVEPIQLRLAMVKRFRGTQNVSLVAREFKTTRQTVCKWITRITALLYQK